MATKRKLHEAGTLTPSKVPGRFRIRIITEGKGSSGTYGRPLLENYGEAFNDSPMFMNHPKDPTKPWERDVTSIAATFSSAVEQVETEDGLLALEADADVDERWAPFVERYGKHIGVSIFISGDGTEDEHGEFQVESFDGSDPYKSVDFVVAAGRGGKVMLENYRAIEASIGSPTDNGPATADADEARKVHHMEQEIKDLKALVEALVAKIGAQDTVLAELKTSVDSVVTVTESADAARDANVDVLEAADKLAEAKLSESARKRVVESVKSGTKLADAITTETAIRDEYLAENETATGTVRTQHTSVESLIPAGW